MTTIIFAKVSYSNIFTCNPSTEVCSPSVKINASFLTPGRAPPYTGENSCVWATWRPRVYTKVKQFVSKNLLGFQSLCIPLKIKLELSVENSPKSIRVNDFICFKPYKTSLKLLMSAWSLNFTTISAVLL